MGVQLLAQVAGHSNMERKGTALANKAVKERRKSRERVFHEPSTSSVAGLASTYAQSTQKPRIQDLCPEDKAKLGEVLRKFAEEKAQRMQNQELYDKKLRDNEKRLSKLRKENSKIKGECTTLKEKFEKSKVLLKCYQEQAQRTDFSPISQTSSEVSHDLESKKVLTYSPEISNLTSLEASPHKDFGYSYAPSAKVPLQLPTPYQRPDSRSAYSQTTEEKGIQAEADMSYSDDSRLEVSSFGQKILYDTVSPQVESAFISPPNEHERSRSRSALDEVKSLKADINSLSASLMKLKGSNTSVSKPEYDSWKQASPSFNQSRHETYLQPSEYIQPFYPSSPVKARHLPDREEERVKRILQRAEASSKRAQELMYSESEVVSRRASDLAHREPVPVNKRPVHSFHEPELVVDRMPRREPERQKQTRLPSSIHQSSFAADNFLSSSVSMRQRPFVEEDVPDFSHNFYDEALFDLVEDLERSSPQLIDDRLIDIIDDIENPRDSFEELRKRASQLRFANF